RPTRNEGCRHALPCGAVGKRSTSAWQRCCCSTRVRPAPAHNPKDMAAAPQRISPGPRTPAEATATPTAHGRRSGGEGWRYTSLSAAEFAVSFRSDRDPQDHTAALFETQRYPVANIARPTNVYTCTQEPVIGMGTSPC
ncbi:hypothetical protein JG688_00018362, partial [Phytophthora aleatoria]